MIPLRFDRVTDEPTRLLFTADSGAFFFSDEEFLDRYVSGTMSDEDIEFLDDIGLYFDYFVFEFLIAANDKLRLGNKLQENV